MPQLDALECRHLCFYVSSRRPREHPRIPPKHPLTSVETGNGRKCTSVTFAHGKTVASDYLNGLFVVLLWPSPVVPFHTELLWGVWREGHPIKQFAPQWAFSGKIQGCFKSGTPSFSLTLSGKGKVSKMKEPSCKWNFKVFLRTLHSYPRRLLTGMKWRYISIHISNFWWWGRVEIYLTKGYEKTNLIWFSVGKSSVTVQMMSERRTQVTFLKGS